MTIEQIRYFLATAETLNFSRAAEILFVHQTTLSRSIASLEEEIGAPLFIRLKYTLKLTSVGVTFRDQAKTLVDSFDSLTANISNYAREFKGYLSMISMPLYFQLISRAYSEFSESYPKTEFSIAIVPFEKSNDICSSVLSRTVDIGLVFSNNFSDPGNELESYPFSHERPCLIVPTNHPLSRFNFISLSDIRDTNILVSGNSNNVFINTLRESLAPNSSVTFERVPTFENILIKCCSGNNAAFLPTCMAIANSSTVRNYKHVLLKNDILDFDLMVIWRKDNNNASLKPFLDAVCKERPEYIQPWKLGKFY